MKTEDLLPKTKEQETAFLNWFAKRNSRHMNVGLVVSGAISKAVEEFPTEQKKDSSNGSGVIPILVILCIFFFTSCQPANQFHLRQVGGNYTNHFSWNSKDKHYEMDLAFPTELYWHYRNLPKTQEYNAYTCEDGENRCMGYICDELNKRVADDHLSDYEMASYILAFVHSIRYELDPPGPTDYPKYPIETLCDMGGDCEDLSGLFAATAKAMGLDVILLEISGDPGHQAAAINCPGCSGTFIIYKGKKYYYCEATCPWAAIGDAPDGIEYKTITPLDIEQTSFYDRNNPSLSSVQITYRKDPNAFPWQVSNDNVLVSILNSLIPNHESK